MNLSNAGNLARNLALALLLFGAPVSLVAQPTLSLASDPVDLSNLQVGDEFTVDVVLEGLSDGDEIDFLAASVTFDDSIIGNPQDLAIGPIVPHTSGFLLLTSYGLAAGTYNEAVAGIDAPITENGTFWSIDFTAAAEGLTDISIGLVDGDGTGFGSVSIGNGLSARVESAHSIPEPNSLSISFVALLGFLRWARSRR